MDEYETRQFWKKECNHTDKNQVGTIDRICVMPINTMPCGFTEADGMREIT